VDDVALKKKGIDRIYDVFALEKEFTEVDRYLLGFARSLRPGQPLTTREFFFRLGERLLRDGQREGMITSAAKAGVPIYCPALGDSSIGIALSLQSKRRRVLFDIVGDIRETAWIAAQSKATGVIYLGGGTPKNFIQQTEVTADLMGLKTEGHRYAIQVTTDSPHWGGLSGCALEEGQSWGKIAIVPLPFHSSSQPSFKTAGPYSGSAPGPLWKSFGPYQPEQGPFQREN
jgi:deoxyhypusine synthase